ncbi:porin family protein [Pedobacter hiemivivus]|uniref:Porin family protein n=1 Tax=Pedobacter hiemivivus TaxID=2530454 RepID=A0A4U1GHQ8_9SPHI|nr:outer membrane beta-barrel protein [Pedobacter hiemivivus]TKC62480.1 porin family protein [Pedobacter hiemivivus]
MKNKLVFAALLCIFSFKANAQTEKGKTMLGGYVSFYTYKFEGQYIQKANNFSTSLRSAYFIKDNLAIGLGLLFNNSRSKESDLANLNLLSRQTSKSYGVSPFVRYYFNINEKFKIFNELAINGSIGTSEYKNETSPLFSSENKFKQFGANIKPGLAFFPTKKIAIEFSFPMLSYQKSFYETKYMENPTEFKNNGESFQFGITTFKPTIGVNYHF